MTELFVLWSLIGSFVALFVWIHLGIRTQRRKLAELREEVDRNMAQLRTEMDELRQEVQALNKRLADMEEMLEELFPTAGQGSRPGDQTYH